MSAVSYAQCLIRSLAMKLMRRAGQRGGWEGGKRKEGVKTPKPPYLLDQEVKTPQDRMADNRIRVRMKREQSRASKCE